MTYRLTFIGAFVLLTAGSFAQHTEIRGFAHMEINHSDLDSNTSFFVGEQDLFITSDITDRISFLGETVFKYSSASPTRFDISVERLIIGYNYIGNHRILIGKHHTPVSDWNDRYHHGRVFFPTVDRPLLFQRQWIPIHTTGVLFQGLNLGEYNVGYQLMVGNGLGSGDDVDDDAHKSLTVDLHTAPVQGVKIGLTGYSDRFSSGPGGHHGGSGDSMDLHDIQQRLVGAYLRYFRGRWEFVSEFHAVSNTHDSTGRADNHSLYAYGGFRINQTWVPYLRYDLLDAADNEIYFTPGQSDLLVVGVRYEFSSLAVAKLEYQHWNRDREEPAQGNGIRFQLAVGF